MKKWIFSGSLVLALLAVNIGFAETELFKVLASNGNAQVKHGNGSVSPATIGKKIHDDDQVEVPVGGYLGLVHIATGRTIELKTPGILPVKELAAKAAAKSSSLADKYAKYVMDELTKNESSDINDQHHKNMKVTGSVERAVSSSGIPVCLPKQSDFIGNSNTITWMHNTKAKGYTIEVYNMFDEVILTKDQDDTSFTFDRAALNLSKDNFFKILVKAKNAGEIKSSEYGLKFITNNAQLTGEIDEIKSQYEDPTAINYLVKASFFRSKKMFLDAKNSYEKAIALEPDVAAYKKAYRFFLEEYGLSEFYPAQWAKK